MLRDILDKMTYHAVYDDSIVAALRYAAATGFAGVQVAVETPHLSFERLAEAEVERIAALRDEAGMWISLHAPDEACRLC